MDRNDRARTGPRVAIVTGASRGIGRAIVLALAAEGMALSLAARDAEALEAVKTEALAKGAPEVLCFPGDLTETEVPAQIVSETVSILGGLDVLINNAGATKRGDFLELSDTDHLDGFALKYHAAVRFCRAAWPHLTHDRGVILMISGIGAHTPRADFTVGGPVNSAMINFAKALAHKAGGGAPRVNVVCPGHVVTDRLAFRVQAHAEATGLSLDDAREALREAAGIARYGTPEDIAAMVAFLCSDAASYVHGAVLNVDGGATPGL
ncbi:SDR family oxidoreductase [Rhodospirillum sp. A1_3_36]|uniref:SDR family oxidoreductase n=1 Tax=Rhodospirillum sp. A1_3_36 TaxID=3391666 RepID=UPI0039A401D0